MPRAKKEAVEKNYKSFHFKGRVYRDMDGNPKMVFEIDRDAHPTLYSEMKSVFGDRGYYTSKTLKKDDLLTGKYPTDEWLANNFLFVEAVQTKDFMKYTTAMKKSATDIFKREVFGALKKAKSTTNAKKASKK